MRTTLSEIIARNHVDLIAEEAHPVRRCLGSALAKEHDAAYIDITMPLDERERRGIRTPGYDRRPEARAHAYREFERFMLERVKACGSKITLVMCGRRHSHGLEQLFSAAGDRVHSYDIYAYDWYRGVPLEGSEGIADYDREDRDD